MNDFFAKHNIELLQSYANKVLQKKYNTTLRSYNPELLQQIIEEQQNNIVTQPLIEKNKIILFHIVKRIEQMKTQGVTTQGVTTQDNEMSDIQREQMLLQRNYQVPENIIKDDNTRHQLDNQTQIETTSLESINQSNRSQTLDYNDLISQEKPKNINFTINIDDASFENTKHGYSNILEQRKREEEIIYKKQEQQKENNKKLKSWLNQDVTDVDSQLKVNGIMINQQNNNTNNTTRDMFLKINSITENSIIIEEHPLNAIKTIKFQKIILYNKGSICDSLFEKIYNYVKDYPYIIIEIFINNTMKQEVTCFQERVCKNQVIFSNNEIITINEGIGKLEIKIFSHLHEPINVETRIEHLFIHTGTTFSKMRKRQKWEIPKFKELLTMDMKYISYDTKMYDIQIGDKIRIDTSNDLFQVKGILELEDSEDVITIKNNSKENGNTILLETSEPVQENSQICIETHTPRLYIEITL